MLLRARRTVLRQWPVAATSGECRVEVGEMCDRVPGVALCERRQHRVEISAEAEPVRDMRSWMISLPTDSAAMSMARCSGVAASGIAESRP